MQCNRDVVVCVDADWLQLIDPVTLERAHLHLDAGRHVHCCKAQGHQLLVVSTKAGMGDGDKDFGVDLYSPA